ncbi:MAG: hypothetical protein FWD39_01910 [Clostridiales bacterium]|nr:hypothetical protein [Clostridiales bacterium]
MSRERKRIYVVAGVFALLLFLGIAYAATTGALEFGGTARITNVRLNIVDENIVSPVSGESVSVNPAGDTLTFTVHFSVPGETRYVKFKIENAGNSDAVLGPLVTTPPSEASGITVDWPSLEGVQIVTGATSSEYTIEVHWSESYPGVTSDVSLSASISYQQYNLVAG